MENATKAFLMAAGVLIGILIMTAFIFVFRKGGQMLETVDNRETSEVIAEYNSKLIIYNRIGDTDNDGIIDSYNTIFDAITAWNLAYDINEQNLHDEKNCLEIDIEVNGTTYSLTHVNPYDEGYANVSTKLTNLIQDYGQVITGSYEYKHKFSGETIIDEKTGKIVKIIFRHIL